MNLRFGPGISNSETRIRFENDSGNYKWRTKDGCRCNKAGDLGLLVAAFLATFEGEEVSWQGFGKEVAATQDTRREEHQRNHVVLKGNFHYLTGLHQAHLSLFIESQ